jgi:hypothetical protein
MPQLGEIRNILLCIDWPLLSEQRINIIEKVKIYAIFVFSKPTKFLINLSSIAGDKGDVSQVKYPS